MIKALFLLLSMAFIAFIPVIYIVTGRALMVHNICMFFNNRNCPLSLKMAAHTGIFPMTIFAFQSIIV